ASDNVWVAEAGNDGFPGNNRVQKFDSAGNFIFKFGDGYMDDPTGIAIGQSRVYVVDNFGLRVFATDTVSPAVVVPPDVIQECNVTGGAEPVSLGTATATDDVDPTPAVMSDHDPGTCLFPLGEPDVTWTAND